MALHDKYFYFWYFKPLYIFILQYFYSHKMLNARLVMEYFYTVILICNVHLVNMSSSPHPAVAKGSCVQPSLKV